MNEAKKKAVVLLSGGLDSYISLVAAKNGYLSADKGPGCCISGDNVKETLDIKLALTFDYGQRAAEDEIRASGAIAKAYNIEHRVIKLPFLAEISNSALNKEGAELEFETLDKKSADAVWVPNRNGLFLNIAACFCDAFNYDAVIIGANKEEAGTFADNSKEFCKAAEECFKYSAGSKPKVIAPLINLEKYEIIDLAVKLGADLSLLKSCYKGSAAKLKGDLGGKFAHCGVCESCKRLKAAILKSGNKDLIKLFF